MLRFVHRLVREIEKFFWRFGISAITPTHAYARCYRCLSSRLGLLHSGPDTFGCGDSLRCGEIWETDRKFVPAPSVNSPSASNDCLNRVDKLVQADVASQMPLRIIHAFEVVYIKHDKSERRMLFQSALHFFHQFVFGWRRTVG